MLPKNYTKPSEYKVGGAKKKTKSSSPKPTNPSLWSRAKSLARQKFDVYPSAYANGWAAKWYKENGGGWSGGSNKKAEGGPVNTLLEELSKFDTKMSPQQREFFYNERLGQRKADLFNEQVRVERVRKNVLPEAEKLEKLTQRLLDSWDNDDPEAQDAWLHFQEMLNPKGETQKEKQQYLREKIRTAPKLLKEALPDKGAYNLFLMNPSKYGPQRELYCTPYGCYVYQKAGAKDLPTVSGNPSLASGAKSGQYPFQPIPQNEAQPGDLGLLVGPARADYGDDNSPIVIRPHHTVVVSEPNPADPNAINAYNAVNGMRLNFFETPVTDDRIDYLRYVGQTPKLQEAIQNQQLVNDALLQYNYRTDSPAPVDPLALQGVPNTLPQNEMQAPPNIPMDIQSNPRGLSSIFPFLRKEPKDLGKVNFSMGGPVTYQQGGSPDRLMQIQNGGTHEESPLGGVPMGTDNEGNQVLVEEGETVRKGEETDFVFSDRLRLTKQDAEEFAIDKKFVGQTFADISKKLETRSRRKNDPIDKQTIDIQLNRLEEAQETFKQRKLAEAQEMYGGSREPSPEQSMEPPMGAEQGPSPEEMAIMQAMQQGAAGMGPQGMGQPSPEMMPPQGPPQMMSYGGLIYDNGGPILPEMPSYETPLGVTAMQAAPVVSNLATAAMLPKGFNSEDYRLSPDDSIVQKKDITPDLQDIDKMTQMGRSAISSRASSIGELLVGLSGLTAMGMAEMGKVRNQQYSDYLQQLEQQKLRNLQTAQMNSQTRAAVDAANADLEKERLNLINAAATEASKVADALRQENLSKYEIEVLYRMYPYLNQFKR